MVEYLTNLLQDIRLADVLDIAFISVLLYAVLTWFRETTSRPVYVGLAILAVVYLLARSFNMLMTTMFFQAIFAVLLVALVVVFQEDLRRIFERVSTLGRLRDTRHRPTSFSHIDTLVTVAADLAVKKVGALIVIKGSEPLDRHIEGGIELDGRISKPVLESIFDPHSMGHDGAVIIERNRLKSFAAHLPLSRNVKEVGAFGTRHSAAVGLTEVCDAFVILVSEERGQISISQEGKLQQMSSPAQLQNRLEKFCHKLYPRKTEDVWKRLLKQHLALKVTSLVLACLAWYLLSNQSGSVQQTFRIPVELRNAPSGLIFDDPPTEIKVTLSGHEREFALIVPSALKVSLDLTGIEEGSNAIPLEAAHVKRPANLAVYGIEPRALYLVAHSLVPAQLPVEVRTEGRVPDGYELKGVQVAPRLVQVMVWRSEKENTRRLYTTPVDLTKVTKTTTVNVALELPRHVRAVSGKSLNVQVTVEIAARPQNQARKESETGPAREPVKQGVSDHFH